MRLPATWPCFQLEMFPAPIDCDETWGLRGWERGYPLHVQKLALTLFSITNLFRTLSEQLCLPYMFNVNMSHTNIQPHSHATAPEGGMVWERSLTNLSPRLGLPWGR